MNDESLVQDKSLQDLLTYKLGSAMRKIPASLYLTFSRYRLDRVTGDGEVPIVFFEDLVERPDHLALLEKIHRETSTLTRLIVFKRRGGCPSLPLKRHLLRDVGRMWQRHLRDARQIIVFCPHTLGGFLVQEMSRASGARVYALQHGYYSFSAHENDIFSRATRAHKAYIFDANFRDFFARCESLEAVGEYFSIERREPVLCPGMFFHIPYLNETNAGFVRRVIQDNRPATACALRFHPRQDRQALVPHLAGCIDFTTDDVLPGDGSVGEVNHFIETSAWHALENNGRYQSYFHRSGQPPLETTLFNPETAQNKLVQSITRDLHEHQS